MSLFVLLLGVIPIFIIGSGVSEVDGKIKLFGSSYLDHCGYRGISPPMIILCVLPNLVPYLVHSLAHSYLLQVISLPNHRLVAYA